MLVFSGVSGKLCVNTHARWETHVFCGSISAGLLKSAVQRVYSTMQDLSGMVDDDHGDSSCDETEASQLCQQLFVLEKVQ